MTATSINAWGERLERSARNHHQGLANHKKAGEEYADARIYKELNQTYLIKMDGEEFTFQLEPDLTITPEDLEIVMDWRTMMRRDRSGRPLNDPNEPIWTFKSDRYVIREYIARDWPKLPSILHGLSQCLDPLEVDELEFDYLEDSVPDGIDPFHIA